MLRACLVAAIVLNVALIALDAATGNYMFGGNITAIFLCAMSLMLLHVRPDPEETHGPNEDHQARR